MILVRRIGTCSDVMCVCSALRTARGSAVISRCPAVPPTAPIFPPAPPRSAYPSRPALSLTRNPPPTRHQPRHDPTTHSAWPYPNPPHSAPRSPPRPQPSHPAARPPSHSRLTRAAHPRRPTPDPRSVRPSPRRLPLSRPSLLPGAPPCLSPSPLLLTRAIPTLGSRAALAVALLPEPQPRARQ